MFRWWPRCFLWLGPPSTSSTDSSAITCCNPQVCTRSAARAAGCRNIVVHAFSEALKPHSLSASAGRLLGRSCRLSHPDIRLAHQSRLASAASSSARHYQHLQRHGSEGPTARWSPDSAVGPSSCASSPSRPIGSRPRRMFHFLRIEPSAIPKGSGQK